MIPIDDHIACPSRRPAYSAWPLTPSKVKKLDPGEMGDIMGAVNPENALLPLRPMGVDNAIFHLAC